MSKMQPPPLSNDLAELLAIERARPGLSAVAEQRILDRLTATVNLPRPRRIAPYVLGAFAGGLVLGAALGAHFGVVAPKLLVLDSPPPPPAQVVVVRTPLPSPSEPPIPVAAARERSHHALPSLPALEEERDSELARERALIETARTALSRKQADGIELLQRHAQLFPRGRLAEERESLFVQALVQAGRIEEARRSGVSFRTRWPHSLLLPVIDAALGASANSPAIP